jgi:hypothetical protein
VTDVGSARVEVTADVRGFARDTQRKLDAALSRLRLKEKVKVDVDEDHADRSFMGLARSAAQRLTEGLSGAFNSLGSTLAPVAGAAGAALGVTLAVALAAAVVPALAAALTAVAGLGLGAGLLGLGAFALKDVKSLQKALGGLGDALKSVGRWAAMPLLKPLETAIHSITSLVKGLGPTFRSIFTGLAPIVQPLTDAISGFVKNVLGGLKDSMPGIVALFKGFSQALPGVGAALGDFFRTIFGNKDLLDNVARALTGLVTGPLKLLGPLISGLTVIFAALNNAVILSSQGWGEIGRAIESFINTSGALDRVRQAWAPLGAAIQVVWDKLKAFAGEDDTGKLALRMNDLITSIKTAWGQLGPFLSVLLSEAWGVIREKWDQIVVPWWNNTAKPWLQTEIKKAFETAFELAKKAVEDKLNGLATSAMAKLRALPGQIGAALSGIVGAVSRPFTNAASAAINGANKVVTGAVSVFRGLANKVGSALSGVKNAVTGAFSGAGSWLLSAGRKIIDGLVSGIRSGFDRVKGLLKSLTSLLPDWKGPAELDKKILRQSGQLVMKGFQSGLEDQFSSVRKTLGGLTGDLPGFTAPSGARRGGDGASAAAPRGPITVNVTINGQGQAAGEEAAEAILTALSNAQD